MKVVLIGDADERARRRAQLNGSALVVGEFPSLREARAANLGADAALVPVQPEPTYEVLTPREIEVLELLAEGLPNKAIADRLRISDQTVKFHVASIAGKLGASNRTDTVRRAVRRGLIAL
jgi:DNA-binding NarL/FixJ family response regulator